MRDSTIYHVQLGGQHKYFGSLAAVYEVFSREELGVTVRALYAFGFTECKPFINDKCTIRKSCILRKKQHKS